MLSFNISLSRDIMARAVLLLLSTLALVIAVSSLGVPRGPNRFFGALNRGREHLLRREFEHYLRTGRAPTATAEPPELWYDGQSVDHFNPIDTRTFSQRFFVNDTYWKPGGPVFLLLGGEVRRAISLSIDLAHIHARV